VSNVWLTSISVAASFADISDSKSKQLVNIFSIALSL
jgi:hypothetical protein